jgi:hypothetical protein
MARKMGYGPNPADNDPQIIDGERYAKPLNKAMSKTAMKGKDEAMKRAKARRAAIKKLIPASPTK